MLRLLATPLAAILLAFPAHAQNTSETTDVTKTTAFGLFVQVTTGAFNGIIIGYGAEDTLVLLPVRADGFEIGVEALSERTPAQLYLALHRALGVFAINDQRVRRRANAREVPPFAAPSPRFLFSIIRHGDRPLSERGSFVGGS